MKLNGNHQLLVCVDDVNLLGDNIDTIKKNMETLNDARKDVGLGVNAEKTKNMLLSHHQNGGQNHHMKTPNGSFGNAAHFKYLAVTVTNQNLILENIKRRLNMGSVATSQSRTFCLLVCCLKKVKVKISLLQAMEAHRVARG
jgi:hypothetical protein